MSLPALPKAVGVRRAQIHPRTLAHASVLFLDELTQSRRDAIEGLRQPLEAERSVEIERDGENRIVRLKKQYDAAPEPGTLEVVRDRAGVKALRKVFAGGIRRSA